MKTRMCRTGIVAASLLLAVAENSRAQRDPAVVGAIVTHLSESSRDLANMSGLWIRDGVFDVSRHDVDYSFGEPLREWSQAEKEALESAARDVGLGLRFCRDYCNEAPSTVLVVAFGEVSSASGEQVIIPIQVDASDEDSSWYTSYGMVLGRSHEGSWSVVEALPGTHGDAVSCFELYGHSCEEEFGPTEGQEGLRSVIRPCR